MKISYENLTPMQIGRLNKSLAKLYRFDNREVKSLGEFLASHEATLSKEAFTNMYCAKYTDKASIEIPKIVFDALKGE